MQKVSKEKKLDRIHDAVINLIERREANDISIYDISKECGMATSTVYHHYPNIEHLFQSLMKDVFIDFDYVLDNCIKTEEVKHWSDINRMIESGYVKYYEDNAIAQKLILSRHTFTSINHSDVENDFVLGKELRIFIEITSISLNYQRTSTFLLLHSKQQIKFILSHIESMDASSVIWQKKLLG